MDHETAQHVADVLKAVAHPVRLQIIELLKQGEMCVGDLVERLGVPQAVASQQLGLMKDKQILQCRRDGTKAFYSIKNANVINLLHCVYHHCEREGSKTSETIQKEIDSTKIGD
ncbi:MAG: winged helix-turn-helix transcriptional regulator [Phycisphaerae bacterium]|nr:winged helix-turn-helix transcriptional regulator [Phycisphaerae bacterium]